MLATPEYLVVGHVTRDLAPDGSYLLGGTATYSGLTAMRLGVGVGVLTSADPALLMFEDEPSAQVCCLPAKETTVFENVYVDGLRKQYVRARAECLTVGDVPAAWLCSPLVHLGPIAQEVDPDLIAGFSGGFLGLTLQGWLRRWDSDGLISPVEWPFSSALLSMADAVVLSPEDVGYDWQRIGFFRRNAPLLVVTMGPKGAIVYQGGREEPVPAYDVVERDPTGAGDVFAGAFFVRLHETGDAIEAARFANSAASFVVEDIGAANVPFREQVEWRLRHGRPAVQGEQWDRG